LRALASEKGDSDRLLSMDVKGSVWSLSNFFSFGKKERYERK
jgi:hypothetical protein